MRNREKFWFMHLQMRYKNSGEYNSVTSKCFFGTNEEILFSTHGECANEMTSLHWLTSCVCYELWNIPMSRCSSCWPYCLFWRTTNKLESWRLKQRSLQSATRNPETYIHADIYSLIYNIDNDVLMMEVQMFRGFAHTDSCTCAIYSSGTITWWNRSRYSKASGDSIERDTVCISCPSWIILRETP